MSAEAAVAAYAQRQRPYNHAKVLVELAAAQAGPGDFEAATETRREALWAFTEMGTPEAEDVRRLLAAHDGRPATDPPR